MRRDLIGSDIGHELLRTFLVAARLGSLSAAAATLERSVSAVSQQIRTLEARLGVPLFERHGRRVRLAVSGEALAAEVTPLIAGLDDALRSARDAHARVRGRVRLGAPRTFTAHWLRPRLPPLLLAYPELELDLVFGVPSLLERQLASGELDVAILARPPELDIVEATPIAVEQFVAVVSPGYLAARGTPATPADLAAHRFIVFDDDRAMHTPWARVVLGARAPSPGHHQIVARIASLEEMLALVEADVAIAVLPDYLVADALAAGRVVSLTFGREPRRAASNTLYRATRRGAVQPARVRVLIEALSEPVKARRSARPRRGSR